VPHYSSSSNGAPLLVLLAGGPALVEEGEGGHHRKGRRASPHTRQLYFTRGAFEGQQERATASRDVAGGVSGELEWRGLDGWQGKEGAEGRRRFTGTVTAVAGMIAGEGLGSLLAKQEKK
jgi:hypothetical protein